METSKWIILVSSCVMATRLVATDAVSVATTENWNWGDAANWGDTQGSALGTYPATADYDVTLANGSNAIVTVQFAPRTIASTTAAFSIGSLVGGPAYRLAFINGTDFYRAFPWQQVTVANPDAFAGTWCNLDKMSSSEICLPATVERRPQLSNVTLDYGIGIQVPDANTTAGVSALRGQGALYATGSGNLVIGLGPGPDGNLYATNGMVEITGRTLEDDNDSPVPGAALHLDASVASTLDTYMDTDGYEHVSLWRDVDGGDISAASDTYSSSSASRISRAKTPFLSDASVSPSGLPMVDFGGAYGSSRPTNCLLKLSKTINNVREVFYVAQITPGSGVAEPTVFGGRDDSEFALQGGGAGKVFSQYAAAGFRFGDVRVNGWRVPYCGNLGGSRHGDNLTAVFVASAGQDASSTDAALVSLIGSCRYYRVRTGGLRLGEALVYTNALTSSQRTRINDYLMKKWLKGHEVEDFGVVGVGRAGNTAVSVPEGNVARVANVAVASGGVLVKEGGGTLSVGAISPANAGIEVRGGTVKLRAAPAVSSSEPAADPYVWLDADNAETVITNHVTNSSSSQIDPAKWYVTRWNDCRSGRSIYAEVPQESNWSKFIYNKANWFTTNYPTVVSGDCNGRNAICFGTNDASASWMWLSKHGTLTTNGGNFTNAYEGFIVCKWNVARGRNYFGSSNTDLLRGTSYANRLLDPANSAPAARAATWTFDGEVRDPLAVDTSYSDTTEYHVVSFSSRDKLAADLLAKDRLYANGAPGDMNIGEFILYDRRLSPAERRQTTAYLLKKWRNQDFPSGTAAAMASLSYPSSETAVIDVDGTVAVGVLSGGNGELVKRGAGSVAVADARALGTLSTISVEEGALNISLDAAEMTLASLQTAALFDYDASVAASFSNEVTVVNGVSRTNVISWADAQGKADKIAYTAQVAGDPTLVPEDGGSLTTRSSPTVEHPTLISVEMPDGQFRPTVDFGALGLSSAKAGAGMHMKRINTGIREIHTMFADTDSAKRGIIVGGRKEDSGFGYCFQRDGSGNGYLLSSSAKDDVKNGYAAIDGVTVAPLTTSLPAGFHLVSFAPRSNMKAATLAMDRTARCGGCRISEQIAFTRALSTGERTILQKHLLRKWLGTARELVANLDSIEVAAGASLSLGDVAVSAETMTGGGTVSASEIRAVSHLILTPSAGPLVAHGTVTFANDTVEIEFAEDLKNLAFGEHTVFSADEITNGTLSMTLAAGVSPRVVPLLMRNGNEIVLRISPRGTRIILR